MMQIINQIQMGSATFHNISLGKLTKIAPCYVFFLTLHSINNSNFQLLYSTLDSHKIVNYNNIYSTNVEI